MAKNQNKPTSPVAGEDSVKDNALQDAGMAGEGQDLNNPDPSPVVPNDSPVDPPPSVDPPEGDKPPVDEAPVQVVPDLPGISTVEKAIAHVKENYNVPATVKRLLVTQDGNVFYDENMSSGYNHAIRNNLKSFALNEWS